jgi:hypothetical protein
VRIQVWSGCGHASGSSARSSHRLEAGLAATAVVRARKSAPKAERCGFLKAGSLGPTAIPPDNLHLQITCGAQSLLRVGARAQRCSLYRATAQRLPSRTTKAVLPVTSATCSGPPNASRRMSQIGMPGIFKLSIMRSISSTFFSACSWRGLLEDSMLRIRLVEMRR